MVVTPSQGYQEPRGPENYLPDPTDFSKGLRALWTSRKTSRTFGPGSFPARRPFLREGSGNPSHSRSLDLIGSGQIA